MRLLQSGNARVRTLIQERFRKTYLQQVIDSILDTNHTSHPSAAFGLGEK